MICSSTSENPGNSRLSTERLPVVHESEAIVVEYSCQGYDRRAFFEARVHVTVLVQPLESRSADVADIAQSDTGSPPWRRERPAAGA